MLKVAMFSKLDGALGVVIKPNIGLISSNGPI